MVTRTRREAARIAGRMFSSIGEELRRAREDAGLSQRQVVHAAGIAQSYLVAIEAGSAEPSLEVVEAIATALGGNVSMRFFPGTGPACGITFRRRWLRPSSGCCIPAGAPFRRSA